MHLLNLIMRLGIMIILRDSLLELDREGGYEGYKQMRGLMASPAIEMNVMID